MGKGKEKREKEEGSLMEGGDVKEGKVEEFCL